MSTPKNTWPTRQVLELACAAQRVNGSYIKEQQAMYSSDGHYMYLKQPNKILMLFTLDHRIWNGDPKDAPIILKVLPEDSAFADKIISHYKRLLFNAIEGENEFLTSVFAILNSEKVPENMFGYVACLPSVGMRDIQQTKVKKVARSVDEAYLGETGEIITDLDAEILECTKSKNFDGYNICAIINNKMASWVSQKELSPGPCVIIKAKVKALGKHWKHENFETRLNYVKAAQ